jgi:hypothetical protein
MAGGKGGQNSPENLVAFPVQIFNFRKSVRGLPLPNDMENHQVNTVQ